MYDKIRKITLIIPCAAILAAGLLCGCQTISPSNEEYSFLKNQAYKDVYPYVYGEIRDMSKGKLNLLFTSPQGKQIVFSDGSVVDLLAKKKVLLKLPAGVYPFKIIDPETGGMFSSPDVLLTGAVIVMNIEKLKVSPTFGINQDVIFNRDQLKNASEGKLSKITKIFNEKKTFICWLGNRKHQYSGGEPSVEFDFSGNPGISALTVDEVKSDDDKYSVFVESYLIKDDYGIIVAREIPVRFTIKGKTYAGFIKNIQDAAFTAFSCIPCKIPEKQIKAADNGTVALTEIFSQSFDKDKVKEEKIAEIIFSRVWDAEDD